MLAYDRRRNRIAEARERAALTQQQLADYVGATDTTIQNYEYGRTDVKVPILVAISEVTGCSLEFLLGIDEPDAGGEVLTADERELLGYFRAMPQRSRDRLLGKAEALAEQPSLGRQVDVAGDSRRTA